MFFTIDPDNGLAIYDQILRQVKFAVASGALQPGQRVPSLQELATRGRAGRAATLHWRRRTSPAAGFDRKSPARCPDRS